jgi:hypothetical protein
MSAMHGAPPSIVRFKRLTSRMKAGGGEVGPCLTDAAREGRSRRTVRVLPLWCRPNGSGNNHRGLLTRWKH